MPRFAADISLVPSLPPNLEGTVRLVSSVSGIGSTSLAYRMPHSFLHLQGRNALGQCFGAEEILVATPQHEWLGVWCFSCWKAVSWLYLVLAHHRSMGATPKMEK